ncbi:hypothetical protein J4Q44_G00054340 [Coregonus suidteri]|uniref:ECSIT N-terminal domain-containing protein n=1 Tax=Coregonus suidteri TaxID=861788 RepID=A0AAN8MFP0_9TELE
MNSARCLLRFQSVGFLAPSVRAAVQHATLRQTATAFSIITLHDTCGQLPGDPVDLARLSLHRIANDLGAKVTVCQMPCTDISESGEEITFPHYLGIQPSPDGAAG